MQDVASAAAGGRVLFTSSLDATHPAESVIDGSSSSFWISTGLFPQELILVLAQPASVASVRLVSTKVRRLRLEGCHDEIPTSFLPLVEKEITDTEVLMQDSEISCDRNGDEIFRYVRVVVDAGWHDFCSIHQIEVRAGRIQPERVGLASALCRGLDKPPSRTPSGHLTLDGSLDYSRTDFGDGTLVDVHRVQVKVWCASGKSCTIAADESWSIGDVKNDVERQLTIPAAEQKMVMGVEPLGDAELLANLAGDALAVDLTVVQCDPQQAIWITQVKRDGLMLRFAKELTSDHDVALAAVLQNGDSLQFASEEMQGAKEIVLAAVRQRGSSVQWASEALRADQQIALAAVAQSGLALQYVAEHFRADRQVVLRAVRQKGSALRLASLELRCDQEIVDAATQNFYFSQEELKALQDPAWTPGPTAE